MKKNKILFSGLALILVLGLVSGCTTIQKQSLNETEEQVAEEGEQEEITGEMSSQEIAKNWIFESSPTYTFSGHDLIQEGESIETEQGTKFVFTFKSNYLGYGDRTAEEDSLTEEEVSHTIEIVVNDEREVVSAVIDAVYDDLNSMMLQ